MIPSKFKDIAKPLQAPLQSLPWGPVHGLQKPLVHSEHIKTVSLIAKADKGLKTKLGQTLHTLSPRTSSL
jgi:hypothetical protein